MDLDLNESLSIGAIVKELRRDSLSIKNRIQSIIHDHYFIESAATNTFPLIPNERCGLWYVPSHKRYETSYFKSTDGHTNQWSFSMRRLNLGLLSILSEFNGIQIVDSTRKGKLMPDALSKTIPIWCAVLNTLIYEDEDNDTMMKELGVPEKSVEASFLKYLRDECKWLWVPSNVISENERRAIILRIDSFVSEVKRLDLIRKDDLIQRLKVRKPILPEWKYPGKSGVMAPEKLFDKADNLVYRVIGIVASMKQAEGDNPRITVRKANSDGLASVSWYYVQGSADDHELWATKDICQGNFSPEFFWKEIMHDDKHREQLIDPDTGYIKESYGDSEVIEKINEIYKDVKDQTGTGFSGVSIDASPVRNECNETNISFGAIASDITIDDFSKKYPEYKQLIVFSTKFAISSSSDTPPSVKVYQYPLDNSKKGAKALRALFPKLIPEINMDQKVLILCDSGKDLSCGLVILLLSKFYDLNWIRRNDQHVTKDTIKKHMMALADVRKINPSRNTLQSVNSYIF